MRRAAGHINVTAATQRCLRVSSACRATSDTSDEFIIRNILSQTFGSPLSVGKPDRKPLMRHNHEASPPTHVGATAAR